MDEYISKESAISIFRAKAEMAVCTPSQTYFDRAAKMLELLPAADVAPVRHARWVDNHCTECGMMPMGDEMWKHCDFDPPLFEKFMDYCPNCGAKMDLEV